MNGSVNTSVKGNRLSTCVKGLLLTGLLLGASACATNRQQTVGGAPPSGFLGDYSQMQAGLKDRANLYYIKDGVKWGQYTKVWVKPVELWKSDDADSAMGKLSTDDQQKLIDFTNTELANALSKDYTLVDHGGPDVLIVHAAITDAKPSKPAVGLVSNVYLPAKVASYGKQEIAGTAIGVGSITIECELLDGATNDRLVAILDSRSGTTAMRSKLNGTWGDVDESIKYWAQRLDTRLGEEKANAASKTDL